MFIVRLELQQPTNIFKLDFKIGQIYYLLLHNIFNIVETILPFQSSTI